MSLIYARFRGNRSEQMRRPRHNGGTSRAMSSLPPRSPALLMIREDPHHPAIWVLLSQKHGDNQQSLAVADAAGLPYEIKRLGWKAGKGQEKALNAAMLADTAEAIAQRAVLGLAAPWPDAVIC